MPILQIVSSVPKAGKTTSAVGLARGFSGAGTLVSLVRVGSGEAAAQDARTFGTYLFVSSPGRAVTADEMGGDSGQLTIVELDAGATPLTGPAILAVRGAPNEGDQALAKALESNLIGTIATAVPPSEVEAVARQLTNSEMRPLALIAEDATLAAPSVSEIRAALGAEVLYESENDLDSVEDILIAPVYADPARPHFRRFAAKAIIAPFNKPDLHLAAIETRAACLVITGGRQPLPYVIDRAQHEPTTILLTKNETPETVAALSDVWLESRFRGERKAAAVFSQMDGRIDFAGLLRRIT